MTPPIPDPRATALVQRLEDEAVLNQEPCNQIDPSIAIPLISAVLADAKREALEEVDRLRVALAQVRGCGNIHQAAEIADAALREDHRG